MSAYSISHAGTVKREEEFTRGFGVTFSNIADAVLGVRPTLFGFYDERHAAPSPCEARPDIVARRNHRSLGQ